MKKYLLGLFTFAISAQLVFGQDTTSLRLVGISPSAELVFLNNDSTVLTSFSTGLSSGHAIFENPSSDTLYAMLDAGGGDRSIYVISPLSGSTTAAFLSSGTFYASADITDDGRVFAIAGNAAGTPGAVFEIDLSSQTETQVAISNTGNPPYSIEMIPDSNKLFVMDGTTGELHTMELDTWTQGLLTTNVIDDIKGMYSIGNLLYLNSVFGGGFYKIDLSQSLNGSLINSPTTDFLDISEFDLISTQDTISFCPGDSSIISSRYSSNSYQWYLDGAAIPGATNMDVYAKQAGTYQLVAEIETTGNYIWSEGIEAEHYTVPNISLSASDSSFCAGDSVLLTGSFGGTSQWYLNGAAIPGANSNTYYVSQGGLYNMTKTNTNGCTDSSATGLSITEINCFQVTASGTDVLCNGLCDGTATATTSAGNPPFTYSWDDPSNQTTALATGLCDGTYVVTATDSNGLTATDTITVSEPTALTATATANLQVLCNTNSSATATASVSGGTAPYAFLWNDALAQTDSTATNLASGPYDVIITDNNACTITASVTVGFVASITSSYTPVCGGICDGSITVSEAGGSAPVSYSWNDPSSQNSATASGLCGNATYIVVATDNDGCTATDSLIMSVPVPLSITINTTAVDCYGGNDGIATASTTGGSNPYTYLWLSSGGNSATETSLATGSYDVIVTDNNGCSRTETAIVSEPAAALSSTMAITNVSCYNGSDGVANLSVSGGTSPFEYDWDGGSELQDTADLAQGTYYVTITDDNGCKLFDTASVSQPTQLILSGSSTADTGDTTGTSWVIASGGTPAYDYQWNDISMQSSSTATGLTSGTYTVTVTDDQGCESILNVAVADTNNSVFQNSFQGDWDDLCRAADNVAGGGYVLAGYTESYGAGGSDASLVVTDENGNFQWSNTYGGAGDDGANAVIQTTDGGFLLCGYSESYGAGGVDVYLIKTDGNGLLSWSNTYGGSGDDRGYSVIETTNGFVIAGGTESFGQGATDAYLLSVDATGTLQWSKTYGGNGNDYGYDVIEVSTGGYMITGNTYSYGAGLADAYLIKVSSSGTLDWTKVFGGSGDDVAWTIVEATDGGFVMGGHSNSYSNGNDDVLLVKTNASGTQEWAKTYGSNGTEVAYDMEVTSSGYAITGYSNSFGSGSDYMYLLVTDANGDNHWSQAYGSTFNDRGWDLVISPNNAYVIAGNTKSFGNNISEGLWETYLVKTDGNGNVNCNQVETSTVVEDTTCGISFGGIEGSGGSETSASTVTNAVSMVGDTLCFTTVGTHEINAGKEGNLFVYPNPNTGSFNILLTNSNEQIHGLCIFNLHGQLITEASSNRVKSVGNHWLVDGLKPGMYFVQLQTKSGTMTQKVICQ